jgi:hypothetical protein
MIVNRVRTCIGFGLDFKGPYVLFALLRSYVFLERFLALILSL